MQKTALFLALVLTASLFLSSCTPSGEASNAAPGQEGGKDITISFIDTIPNPLRAEVFEKIIAQFEEQNPGIKVELQSVPWDQAHGKLVELGASSSMPDVIQVHHTWATEFAQAGWIDGLDSYLDTYEHKDGFTDFCRSVLMDAYQKDVLGEVYVVPDGILAAAMFVRTDWLAEEGLSTDNWKWSDYFNYCNTLTSKEKNRYGMSFRGGRSAQHPPQFLFYAATGGRIYDETGKCLFDSPESVALFTQYIDLYKNASPADSASWGYSEMVQGFTSGLTGILLQTSEVVSECEAKMDADTWDVVPLPVSDADGNFYNDAGYSNGYAISSNSEHKEAAWKFIAYLSSPEVNAQYCKENYIVPIMKTALDDPFFSSGKMKGYADMFRSTNFVAWPSLGYFPEVGEYHETFGPAEVQKCIMGEQTPEETCKNLADFLTKYQQKFMAENPDVPIPQPAKMS